MSATKPIRIFYSRITHRFYASSRYRLDSVTEADQIGAIVEEHQIEFVPKPQKATA